jgi:phage-related protein
VPGQIKSVFSGAGSWLYGAGRNILKGLTSGMKGAVGEAISAAKHAAQQVIGGLKSALGIASPSKVAADEVGRWIPPGITEGIAKQMPKEQQKINGMTPAVVGPAVQNTVAASTEASAPRGAGVTIGQLVVHLQGVFDMTDPLTARKIAAKLYAALKQYEREYA